MDNPKNRPARNIRTIITRLRDVRTCRYSARCDITGDEERVVVSLLRPRPVRRPWKLFEK